MGATVKNQKSKMFDDVTRSSARTPSQFRRGTRSYARRRWLPVDEVHRPLDLGELTRFAALGVNDEQLRVGSLDGDKRQLPPIRTPADAAAPVLPKSDLPLRSPRLAA